MLQIKYHLSGEYIKQKIIKNGKIAIKIIQFLSQQS